jgi:hypothetical protein
MSRRRRAKLVSRLAFELTVVLVGVFLAIRLQAWADDTAEYRAAFTTLESLRSELEGDRRELGAVQEYQTAMGVNYRRLAGLLRDDPSAHMDEIDHLIREDLRPNRTWFPQSAAYETLVSTGQIVALGSIDLQVELARLYERSYSRLVYNGELYDQAYLEEYNRAVTEHWDYATGRLFSSRPSDNLDLANVALRLAIWTDAYLDVLSEYAPQMDSTLAMVDAALNGR